MYIENSRKIGRNCSEWFLLGSGTHGGVGRRVYKRRKGISLFTSFPSTQFELLDIACI